MYRGRSAIWYCYAATGVSELLQYILRSPVAVYLVDYHVGAEARAVPPGVGDQAPVQTPDSLNIKISNLFAPPPLPFLKLHCFDEQMQFKFFLFPFIPMRRFDEFSDLLKEVYIWRKKHGKFKKRFVWTEIKIKLFYTFQAHRNVCVRVFFCVGRHHRYLWIYIYDPPERFRLKYPFRR